MSDATESFRKLIEIVDTLMGENGCPWDNVQTRESLKPYLVEEAYEVLEALDTNDPDQIKDEMGDLLYQILFHSKISSKSNEFDIKDVLDNLREKMVRRHPHVFKEGQINTPDQVIERWEEIKKEEKTHSNHPSILDSVPKQLPSLLTEHKNFKRRRRKKVSTGMK